MANKSHQSQSSKGQKPPRKEPNKHNLQTHGGHIAVSKYRARELDMRKNDDRALVAFRESIVSDLGGLENMETFQAALLDRCVELLIILRCMGAYAEENGVMGEGGELIPCLRTSYVAYLNSFRLTLSTIYERTDKRPPKGPTLKEYVSSKYGEVGDKK